MQIQWLDVSEAGAAGSGFLLALDDGEGHTGLGEVALSAGRAGAAALDLARASAAQLAASDLRNINVALDAVSSVTDQDATTGPVVRAAFDVALHDLNGQLRGCPVHVMLGGSHRTEVALAQRYSSGAAVPHHAGSSGAVILDYRMEASRVAASFGPGSAMGWLAATVDRLGAAVQVDIDADGLFDNPALARSFIEGLLTDGPRLNIGLLQPLNEADLVGHAALCASLPIPVILERSVRSAKVMGQIVRLGAADRIVVNVERVGGLRAAMQVVSIAEAAAIGISAASSARSAVGAAAALHLAAVLHDTFPARLDFFRESPAQVLDPGFTIEAAVARIGSAPGLGVALRDEAIAAFQHLA